MHAVVRGVRVRTHVLVDVHVDVRPLLFRCPGTHGSVQDAASAHTLVSRHPASPEGTGPQRDGQRSLNVLCRKVKGPLKEGRGQVKGHRASRKGLHWPNLGQSEH